MEDPRLRAARYRVERLQREESPDATGEGVHAAPSESADATPTPDPSPSAGAAARAAYVEIAIQQAIRRGDFDDLPGAGKPLPDLGRAHDPDWWIRRKIEREQLTGLGPPALTLRVEDAELPERLDALSREEDVREAVEDFNRRVKLARMQLLGGPPVVTSLRDIEVEVAAWHARRRARMPAQVPPPPPRRWWRRR
ncbi:DUF1992 domain-containing protein [Microbacterium invictum]|uniref:DUF1992 domain-containing protein n=1 Tax=Microbacterium invictum TaxID=515415 RepID=A0ABZ0VD46_9MICO|nr:DUF1992 domain-containing protein [Microbacterium invictum]WQB71154.1 DUF1992 domain-containing protein [Microbacterium invictum]